jgi:UDP-N-acetylmuramoyl-tripeptide--D-alanyl-D-alanine ligase
MYELGRYEEEGHKLVGRRARVVADLLVTVGALGRLIADEALNAGMPADAVHVVDTNAQATDLLREILQEGGGNDRVLVKGSRGLEMEEIVAALTSSPGPPHLQSRKSLS